MAFDALNDLYREVIFDHYVHPRLQGTLYPHDVEEEGFNPLCGDHVTLQLRFEGDTLRDIGLQGKGCSISQASASILSECVIGQKIEAVETKIHFFKDLMQGKASIADQDVGDLEALEGVRKFPVRIKCALLAWTTLESGLAFFKNKRGG